MKLNTLHPGAVATFDQIGGKFEMSANDMDHARKTYGSFMGALKWTVPLIAIITFIVIMLIAPAG
jgi:hypothetical protein